MGRKIILLSDGTGNSAAKIWKTNVRRTFECLDLAGNSQVAIYDDGVGSSRFRPFALLAGAVGWGLKRNVLDLYKFACRNHDNKADPQEEGGEDEIFGFGFSRGAFTIRVVTALIAHQGLVDHTDENDLHRKALAAYRAYRADRYALRWPWHPEKYLRKLRDLVLNTEKLPPKDPDDRPKIAFLGLWDTVAAYGMPIEVMSRGVNDWIWPLGLPDQEIRGRVGLVCHALAIDDDRKSFHPVLLKDTSDNSGSSTPNVKIEQVWFAGAHSNVGGGYPDDSLAHIPLCWILSEAAKCGLAFKTAPDSNPQTYQYALTAQDKDGRIYDPRAGLGAYYGYSPRDIAGLMAKQGCRTPARIHESVFLRIRNRAHVYSPVGLPERYEIATYVGQVLQMPSVPGETATQASARAAAQRDVWNRVGARQIAYLLTVLLTATLFLYPLFDVTRADDFHGKSYRWFSELIEGLSGFLPSGAAPWIEGYARDPWTFFGYVGVIGASLWVSKRFRNQIASGMEALWRGSLSKSLPTTPYHPRAITQLRETANRFAEPLQPFAPVLSAVMIAILVFMLVNRVAFKLQDYAGLTCPATPGDLRTLSGGDYATDGGTASYAKVFDTLSDEQKREAVLHLPSLPTFDTKDFCRGLGVQLEKGRTYLIQLQNPSTFMDGDIPADRGFYAVDVRPLWRKALVLLSTPLKRAIRQKWFTVTVRVGSVGPSEEYLLPEAPEKSEKPEKIYEEFIKPNTTGELFLYVNDAVFGWPGLYDLFYDQFPAGKNTGSTRVLIRQVIKG